MLQLTNSVEAVYACNMIITYYVIITILEQVAFNNCLDFTLDLCTLIKTYIDAYVLSTKVIEYLV